MRKLLQIIAIRPETPEKRSNLKITLNEKELEKLVEYGVRAGRARCAGKACGGFQNLARTLHGLVDKCTGELVLDDILIARIIKYSENYKRGGFQDSFLRPVFGRFFESMKKEQSERRMPDDPAMAYKKIENWATEPETCYGLLIEAPLSRLGMNLRDEAIVNSTRH